MADERSAIDMKRKVKVLEDMWCSRVNMKLIKEVVATCTPPIFRRAFQYFGSDIIQIPIAR